MSCLTYGNAVVIDGGELTLDLCIDGGEIGIFYKVSGDTHGTYPGPYVVIPKVIEQVLPTENLIMREDVIVKEVPYEEVSNEWGTTVSIVS